METKRDRLVVVPAHLLDDLLEVSSEAARRLRHADSSDAMVADAVSGSVASVRTALLLEP